MGAKCVSPNRQYTPWQTFGVVQQAPPAAQSMHWNCSVIQRRQQLPQSEKESGVDMDHA